MKGLLIKDFYTVVTQLKIFVILIIVFALIPGYSMGAFAMVYAALLPINALAWDEQSKWDNLARMMPYSRFDLVFSKYLIGYIYIAAAALLCTAGSFAYSLLPGKEPFDAGNALTLVFSGAAALLLLALNLPLMFRMGVEKGRLFFGIMVGAFCALIALGGNMIDDGAGVAGFITSAKGGAIAAAVLAATVLINAASVALSVKWYGKRD